VKFEKTKREETRCDEAAESVSMLCDGETIPREMAEHIGGCAACRARLKQYAEMGAELRRLASLQAVEETKASLWGRARRITPHWWEKGLETMRIPRFAFALLLAAIVVLGSSLTIMRVRAHTQGPVLMLMAKSATGHIVRCALSILDSRAEPCSSVQMVPGGAELTGFRVISEQGDRIELGVRAGFLSGSGPFSSSDTKNFPEAQYWYQFGEKLEVKMEGADAMTVTGELVDHMPPSLAVGGTEQLDPNQNELRFISPVLVQGKAVLCDFGGIAIFSSHKDEGLELSVPHDGRYLVSLSPLKGAVEGRIKDSRVIFELNGQPYQFLTGAPVARGETIWILHLPSDKESDRGNDHAFGMAGVDMSPYLVKKPTPN
jgi:hypothetical protein